MKPTKLLDYEQEYIKYKKNNRQLSKALAEQQQLNKRYLDENNVLQKKLYISSTLNMRYEQCLNDLLKYLKQSLNSCIDLTNIISPTLILCKEGIDLQKTLDVDNEKFDQYKISNSPGNAHRMQAVKPMVSGHVIHHPTINLSRINQPFVANSSSVQNFNSNSNTNATINEPISNNINNSNNHLDDYQFNLDDDETDESVNEDLETAEEIEPEVQISRSLHTIIEYSEEASPETPNNSITRELRIVIEPLNANSFSSNNTPTPKEKKPKSRRLDDPLEGTSSMLDSSGNVIEFSNYVPKPRNASKKITFDLDSDSEDSEIDGKNKSKWVGKRKHSVDKKDVTGQKYKVKRNRSDGHNSSSSPIVENENSIEDMNITNNIDETRFSSERVRRRPKAKSLAEPSLKKKLRR